MVVGQVLKRRERLLEHSHRFAIRIASGGLESGLPGVRYSLIPHLAPERVIGKVLHVLDEPRAMKVLDRIDDAAVHLTATLSEQALVGDVLGESMLEDVNSTVRSDPFVDELAPPHFIEMQCEVVAIPHGLEEPRWELTTHDGGRLEGGLGIGRESIDPGGQQGVDCIGQFVATPLKHGPRELLNEKRVALRLAQNHRGEWLWQRLKGDGSRQRQAFLRERGWSVTCVA